MPQIPTYTAPKESLTPSSRGVNAWESAARRISAFAGAEAGDARAAGALKAVSYKQLLWPFDILELYERKASQAAQTVASTSTKSDRINVRVVGSLNPENAERRAAGGYDYGSSGGAQQIARGAGALGGMLSDGGARASQRLPGKEPESLSYEGGQLMTTSEARKAMDTYNTERDTSIAKHTDALIETQNYGDRYGYDRPSVSGDYGGESIPDQGSVEAQPRLEADYSGGNSWSDTFSNATSFLAPVERAMDAITPNFFGGTGATASIPRE